MSKLWALLGSVALVLAACSPGGELAVETVDADDGRVEQPSDIGPQALAAAASRTADVDSARFSIGMQITDFPLTGDLEFSVDGLYIDGGERVGMIMDLAPLFEQLGAEGEIDQFLGGSDSLVLEYRMIGDFMYMRSPMLAMTGMVDADRWIRVDMAEAAGLSGVDVAGLTGNPFGVTSADAFLAFLEASGSETTDLGELEIRGTPTQGLATTVRLGDLYALGDPQTSTEIESFFDQLDVGGAFDLELPIQAYVDDDGLVRRMVMIMSLADMAEAMGEDSSDLESEFMGSFTMTIIVDMYDFGVEAEIDEPFDFVDLTAEFLAGDL